jgi:hypothetical protein
MIGMDRLACMTMLQMSFNQINQAAIAYALFTTACVERQAVVSQQFR